MKKRLLAWVMFLVMTLGLIPASAIEWVYAQPQLLSGDDSGTQVEQTTVEVKYSDKNRTAATIAYHKKGLDAEPVNMIFLVDDSAKGEQSYRIFEQMMYDNGIEYVLGHWSATTAQLITYQNTADVGEVYTYDTDFRYALITSAA